MIRPFPDSRSLLRLSRIWIFFLISWTPANNYFTIIAPNSSYFCLFLEEASRSLWCSASTNRKTHIWSRVSKSCRARCSSSAPRRLSSTDSSRSGWRSGSCTSSTTTREPLSTSDRVQDSKFRGRWRTSSESSSTSSSSSSGIRSSKSLFGNLPNLRMRMDISHSTRWNDIRESSWPMWPA